MKLDKDLVRSLLLELEEKEGNSSMNENELHIFCEKNSITIDTLLYTMKRLEEADFINIQIKYASNKPMWYRINSITYNGHQFIDTVRDSKVWAETKRNVSTLADVSLSLLFQVAVDVAKKYIGL